MYPSAHYRKIHLPCNMQRAFQPGSPSIFAQKTLDIRLIRLKKMIFDVKMTNLRIDSFQYDFYYL